MAKSSKSTSNDLYAGLSRSNSAGDSGMRPGKASVNDGATRDGPARSSSLSGREA